MIAAKREESVHARPEASTAVIVLALGLTSACARTRTPRHDDGVTAGASAANPNTSAPAGLDVDNPGPPEPPRIVAEEQHCSRRLAERVSESCDFVLAAALPRERCSVLVELDDRTLPCNDADGWTAIDELRIRLHGAACVHVLSDALARVVVTIPCPL
jgi:hypothetical protein